MSKKIAVVFPGQGSQSVNMLSEFATKFPIVTETFKSASDALGFDLWSMVQNGPEEELNNTINTQPALLTAGVAIWRVLQSETNIEPALLAGHSLGEYSALVCAGSLDFNDTVKLVALRGKLMQDAVEIGKGAMAAIIGLNKEKVAQVCKDAAQNQIVTPANYNAIGQIVVAGDKSAVERAVDLAKQAGAKIAKILPVSVPSHCELMKPAAEKFSEALKDININTPNISIINNVDVASVSNADEIRDALCKQLYNPVRWIEIIQFFVKEGIEQLIECGPGNVLTGLTKRIDKSLSAISLATPQALANLIGN